jgi:hypothetical protein
MPVSFIQNASLASGVPSSVSRSALPAGTVLQVVQGTTSTPITITGTTYTDSGLTASITPTSASSRILVLVSQQAYIYTTSSDLVAAGTRLLRDATVILNPTTDATGPLEQYIEIINAAQIYNAARICINLLDSPATTSAVTYKTQGRLRTSGAGRAVSYQTSNTTNGTSTIILMEIAA